YYGSKEARMQTTYRLRVEELEKLIKILKNIYPDKEIEITVQEIEDETGYLLKDEANRKHLEKAVAADKAGKYYRTVSAEELETMLS
ncbi:MAG: hypothetical protein LBK44_00060, partial [Spirochaetales bacterium]|nr:hypothetical protein [Spirochaetales bacterium]